MGNTKKGTKPTVKTVNFYSVLSSHVKRFSASVKNQVAEKTACMQFELNKDKRFTSQNK